ncbi:MAG TPA: glycosyltransferase family protein [Propionibacteriaceae bacterium]
MSRTVAIIQARTGSSRLPGKVLLALLGAPMLAHVVERTSRARLVDEVVVATTQLAADDAIAVLAKDAGWALVRGSETDLLDRYVAAARAHAADVVVVRITSDCPLIDPELVDDVVRVLATTGADYASNTLEPRTYPRGLDVEAITRAALELASAEDTNPTWREHATPYIYRHPERFRLARVASPEDTSGHRWCVDTLEDFELVHRIYDELGNDRFGWREALMVVRAHPEWADLNRDVIQKSVLPG